MSKAYELANHLEKLNINNMYKCPDCGEVLEPGFCFCPGCGKALTWEDFK